MRSEYAVFALGGRLVPDQGWQQPDQVMATLQGWQQPDQVMATLQGWQQQYQAMAPLQGWQQDWIQNLLS
jgi:hypothetical protein